MNASFRTAFWAMCLGLTVPMMLLVGVEMTSHGRGARGALTAGNQGGSLRNRLESAQRKSDPGKSDPGKTAQGRSAPASADDVASEMALNTIGQVQLGTDLEDESNDPKIVLGLEPDADPIVPEPSGARQRRLPAYVTGARSKARLNPDLEPLPAASSQSSAALEARLAGIQQHLDKIGQSIAGQAQREAAPDPVVQAAELLKQLQQARAIDKLASRINEQVTPDTDATSEKKESIRDDRETQPVEPKRPDVSLDKPAGQLPESKPRLVTKIYHPRYVGGSALHALVAPLLTEGLGKAGAADAGNDEAVPGTPSASAPALVVHDLPEVLRKVDRLIEKVDVPPTPVAIEAVVLSLRLNDGMPHGIDLLDYNSTGQPFAITPADASRLTSPDGSKLARPSATARGAFDGRTLTRRFGLKCGVLTGDPQALITSLQAAAQTSRVNAWQMTVSSRHSADLMLNEPFGSTVSGKPASVGTRLKVHPVVARNGLIHLDVHSESDLDPGSSGTRAAALNNQFALEQGQTAIIAGFFAEQTVLHYSYPQTSGQVALFGKSRRDRAETTEGVERIETIVLLTPHIVSTEGAGEVGKTETPAARTATPAAKKESGAKVRLAGTTEDARQVPAAEPRRRSQSPGTTPVVHSTTHHAAPAAELVEPKTVPETNATPIWKADGDADASGEPDVSSIPPLSMPELNNDGPRITPGRRSKSAN